MFVHCIHFVKNKIVIKRNAMTNLGMGKCVLWRLWGIWYILKRKKSEFNSNKMGNSDEVVASSEFHLSDICHVTECTAAQTPPFSVWVAWSDVFPCSCRKRYTPDICSCRQPPTFGSACFWVSSRFPTNGMDRHCRQAWQGADYLSRTAGTSRRISASLSAEARPPAASSWYVPNTFRPAVTDVHTLHTGDVFPSANPQNTSCIAPPSQMVTTGR